MKEIKEIIKAYDKIREQAVNIALATVIEVKGSSYRRTGARMLIQDNGFWTGGISGGCIEGNALKKANVAIHNNQARVVTYDTANDDESQIGVSLGCNGVISVLITPIDKEADNNPVEQLRKLLDNRQENVLITIIEDSANQTLAGSVINTNDIDNSVLSTSGSIDINLKNELKAVLKNQKSRLTEINENRYFVEYIPPAIQLIIAGGNYDIVPLLQISHELGWQTVVVYNKSRLTSLAKSLASKIVDRIDELIIDSYSVAVLMSHDYNADLSNLKGALSTDLQYIGLLGPASRRVDMLAEIQQETGPIDENRVFGPAGLDIGAAQPEEIAISIVSEIIAILRHRPGSNLKKRTGPIYDRST